MNIIIKALILPSIMKYLSDYTNEAQSELFKEK